jgi:aspartate carbamoyltransferase catalytic subunit
VTTLAVANQFAGNRLISMAQYNQDDLELLRRTTDEVRLRLAMGRSSQRLVGKLLMSAFFDTGTRTRLARETAMIWPGGTVATRRTQGVTR